MAVPLAVLVGTALEAPAMAAGASYSEEAWTPSSPGIDASCLNRGN